eukprot:362835-Chlamydomonas_euryale.AAC.4
MGGARAETDAKTTASCQPQRPRELQEQKQEGPSGRGGDSMGRRTGSRPQHAQHAAAAEVVAGAGATVPMATTAAFDSGSAGGGGSAGAGAGGSGGGHDEQWWRSDGSESDDGTKPVQDDPLYDEEADGRDALWADRQRRGRMSDAILSWCGLGRKRMGHNASSHCTPLAVARPAAHVDLNGDLHAWRLACMRAYTACMRA